MINSIVYDNLKGNVSIRSEVRPSKIKYCCTPEIIEGKGNITNYPIFNDSVNYKLNNNSPCKDAGKNRGWMRKATDVFGYDRIINNAVDIGANEYVGN